MSSSRAGSAFRRLPVCGACAHSRRAGYIKGYRALLDEKRLGYEVTVFAMVHLASQSEADLKAFEDFVRGEPLVRECWMLSGEIDFILKCVAPNLEDLPRVRRRAHRGAARPQRQDVADAAQFQGRRDGADGAGGGGLKVRESARGRTSRAPSASLAADHRHSTFLTSKALAPPGVATSTLSPLLLPMSARESGEEIEMRPFLASASWSPTICYIRFWSVSSSIRVTVAPNLTLSPERLDTSITSARASMSSSSATRPSMSDWRSLAA